MSRCAKVRLSVGDAAQWFASRTAEVSGVMAVALVDQTLWTVISSDDSRKQVCEIEHNLQRFMYKPLLEFRLVNMRELSEPMVLPIGSQVLFTHTTKIRGK